MEPPGVIVITAIRELPAVIPIRFALAQYSSTQLDGSHVNSNQSADWDRPAEFLLTKKMADTFRFETATANDRQKVLDFLCDHFLVEETMNVALRLKKEDFLDFVGDVVDECISSGHSVLALDNETGQVAGLVLNTIWHRGQTHAEAKPRPLNPNAMEVIEVFLTTFADAFWRLVPPNVNAVLHREILSVGAPWQRRGIASRLIEEGYSVEELKKANVQGFASKTSSLANQMLMEKKGYKELMSIPFSSVVGIDGTPLVQPQDGTTKNVLYWKALN